MKRSKQTVILVLISLFIIISCSKDNRNEDQIIELNPLEEYEAFDIAYGTDSEQVFDLFLPQNRNSNTKTIILVHGGGWTSGDKSDMDDIKDIIKTQLPDYAIVNMNYRLADTNNFPYPMQTNDITSLVNYLNVNTDNYNISNRIGFIGASAGAHLSMLWSYISDSENQTNIVCSIVGPTNFTDPAYLDNPVYQQILNTFSNDISTSFLEEVSPYHRVTTSAPPTILFYGGQDPLVPTSQGTDMRDKLQELNVTHQFVLYPNEGHGWGGLNWFDTVSKLKVFIETHL